MTRPRERDPRKLLAESVNDLRVVGGIFVIIGGIIAALVFRFEWGRLRAISTIGLALANAIVLVGPGAWYLVAAHLLKQLHFGALRISIYVVIGQVGIVFGIIGLAIVLSSRFFGEFIVPVVMVVFFVPAVLVSLVHINRVRQVAHLLTPLGRAFELQPASTLRVPDKAAEKGGADDTTKRA